MMFTENEGWFQQWGQLISIRKTSDVVYYMWDGEMIKDALLLIAHRMSRKTLI